MALLFIPIPLAFAAPALLWSPPSVHPPVVRDNPEAHVRYFRDWLVGLLPSLTGPTRNMENSGTLRTLVPFFAPLKNRLFRRLLLVFVVNGSALGVAVSVMLFYVEHVLKGNKLQAGIILLIYFGSAAASVPMWMVLSRRFSKTAAWFIAMVIVGGLGSITGALIGVFVIKAIQESFVTRGPGIVTQFPSLGGDVLFALMNGVKIDLSTPETAAASANFLKQAISSGSGAEINIRARNDEHNERQQLVIERNHHGNLRTTILDEDFLLSGDFRQIDATAQMLQGLIGPGAVVKRGDSEKPVREFSEAMTWLLAEVERGASMQRYKGLGEMNPEQLWETTMDPAVRRLLRVQIDDAIEADRVFTMLMGDEVEPRRDFIENNALRAANIDV